MFFFSSRRRHTRCSRDWSSDVCSSDLADLLRLEEEVAEPSFALDLQHDRLAALAILDGAPEVLDRFDGQAVQRVDGIAGLQTGIQAAGVERASGDDDAARLAQVHQLPDLVVDFDPDDAEPPDQG